MASQDPASPFRLSRDVLPTHYKLAIKTDLDALTFEGKVEIDLEVCSRPSESHSITLHAASNLRVHSAVLAGAQHSNIEASDIHRDSKLERAIIDFPANTVNLVPGQKYTLSLRFESALGDTLMGYYRSTHKQSDGSIGFDGVTLFAPTAARKALPCFDEPDMKATFAVTLLSREGLTVLSNMPAKSIQAGVDAADFFIGDSTAAPAAEDRSISSDQSKFGADSTPASKDHRWTATTFQTTPKMSTYLLAWAKGDFRHLESSYTSPLTGRKVPLRIYASPEHIHQAQLTLDVTAKVLPVYEKLFDIEYPLPKLDTLVANDYESGAMENWGFISGATIAYLFDDKNGSIQSKKVVANIQSHEVAHQWFGNVVTMRWWDNLWLNEAFATVMGELISIAAVYPEWNSHSSFIDVHLRRALELDAQRSSHPVEQPCPDPEMISQIFDAISYSKGASILRMLSNMIGEEAFLKGVSIYLKKHLYGNSQTADLWKGISQASGVDVAKIMANWTLKVGFPVITVEETGEGLKVRQNRFLSTGDPTPEEDETLWYVPLELKTVDKSGNGITDHKAVLESRGTILALDNAADITYKLNAETAGVYRVSYSPERLGKLGDEAGKGSKGAFSLNDRIGLVQDAFVLARSGYSRTSGSLSLVSKLKSEEENLVWKEIATGLADLKDAWWEQPDDVRDALDKLARETFAPVTDRLGWDIKESDSSDIRELRATALNVLAGSGDEDTIKEIHRRFSLFMDQNDATAIPGDFLDFILINATRFGGVDEYDKVKKLLENPPSPQHKLACIRALCAAQDAALIERTFSLLHSDEVKMQDVRYFMTGLAANRHTRRQLWQDFQKDLPNIVAKFTGSYIFGNIIQASFNRFSSDEDLAAIVEFFKDKDTKEYDQALNQALDAVRAKAAWLKRDSRDVEDWLKQNSYLA